MEELGNHYDDSLETALGDEQSDDNLVLDYEQIAYQGVRRTVGDSTNPAAETDYPDIDDLEEDLDPTQLLSIKRDGPKIDKEESDKVKRQRRRRRYR
jgi:hypothetical protein